MPKLSPYTELLSESFLVDVDALCEEIKAQLGWPPLGQKELSPSGARGREKADAAILAELFERVGPERSVRILKAVGLELLDEFGERVVSDALARASASFGGGIAGGQPEPSTTGGVPAETGGQ